MKKILIYGISGFIGSALAKYLHEKNYKITGCDIKTPENLPFLSRFYKNRKNILNEIFEEQQFDVCVNCAGSASVPKSFNDPFSDYELNTRIVFKILTAIKDKNPDCKFINLSSAAVYGNPQKLPVSEDHQIKPISPYGNHKYMSELICKQFYDFFNIKTCSLRIFSAFGPGLKKQLFWDLYKKSQKNTTVELFGTGNETRDFIFIDDLVKAMELIINSDFKHREINIANGNEIKIKDAVNIFFSFLSPKINYKFTGNEKKGDPVNWKADIEILKSLGYKKTYTMQSGLKKYVEWLKKEQK